MSLLAKLDKKEPVTVVVTGACGQIAYNLIFLIARGDMLGADQPVNLRLLDLPSFIDKLEAVCMELDDCASSVVASVVATAEPAAAFKDADLALLVGARPRGPGMERKDLLQVNAAIFKAMGAAIEAHASRDIKVLVVGNPANTNALITAVHAPSIPRENFTALTRLDQNRATTMVARKAGVAPKDVSGVLIWGNHSTTQYPDARAASLASGAKVKEVVTDVAWLQGEFITTVQNRGKAVIDKRGASSAASAANAIVDHAHDWLLGSAGKMVSMGVYTTAATAGGYGVASDLIFSLPCLCERGGRTTVVQGLPLDDFSVAKLKATEAELLQEKELAFAQPAAAGGAAAGSA